MRLLSKVVLILPLLTACVTTPEGDPTDSVYVSDYLAFLGNGSRPLMLVLGRIKSRSGLSYSERYLGALYEDEAWRLLPTTVDDMEPSRNPRKDAGSPAFTIEGTPTTGMTLVNAHEHISLQTEPSTQAFSDNQAKREYSVETAVASLNVGEQTINGWMVHEHLIAKKDDTWRELLTSTPYQSLARIFLRLGHSGVFYMHGESDGFANGPQSGARGFTFLNGKLEAIKDIKATIYKEESSGGLFRWARAGTLAWQTERGPGSLEVEALTKLELANWLVGGASLDAVGGEFQYLGQKLPIVGTIETLK